MWKLLKKLIKLHKTNYRIRCVDFSPDGESIVIGTSEGEVVLYSVSNDYQNLNKMDSNRQRKACVTDIKWVLFKQLQKSRKSQHHFCLLCLPISRFSPRKSYLAAGSSDLAIDFFEIINGKMKRIAYCTQLPGPVLQIDWSTSAEYIKVLNKNLLYFTLFSFGSLF